MTYAILFPGKFRDCSVVSNHTRLQMLDPRIALALAPRVSGHSGSGTLFFSEKVRRS